jgi:competence protein ComEA
MGLPICGPERHAHPMIDDPDPYPRPRRPPDDEPGWGDPFASFATLSDPDAALDVPLGRGHEGPLVRTSDAGVDLPPGVAEGRSDVTPDVLDARTGGRSGSGGRRSILMALLRPWFEPRPGELRGAILLLAVALAVSLALWFDASRRPSLESGAAAVVPALGAGQGTLEPAGEARPGSVDGSDGWGLSPGAATQHGPVVHVSGAVRDPGVVTLTDGSRVADAITASGGAMPDARLDRLNLARRVDDGERIHVPRVGEDAPPPEEPASRGVLPDGRIDLNAASQAELETLPGVGPARAQAIIAERETRPFRVPGDLRRVPGIGEATFQRLAPLVTVR